MTTSSHLDVPAILSTGLVTAIDHVGVAVPDLDAAIEWYHQHLGMILVHEEINEGQGVREAMLSFPGAEPGSAQLQLMSALHANSPISKFLDTKGPGLQQLAYRVTDIDALTTELRAAGIRVLYDQPRAGTAGSRINFLHPKDTGGVLIELVQASGAH